MKEVLPSEAWSKKYPEAVVLAISWDKVNNRADIITLGWSMTTSIKPPMAAISIGNTRYSHKTISETGEFVLAFPTEKMEKEIMLCGSKSGRDTDKFKEAGLTPVASKLVKPPLIKECLVNMECKVVEKTVTGDHTIFVGEILTAYISEENTKRIYNTGNFKFKGF
jgi:flavin reductase (DIM6/NTAB) family NADH-FMN oxidoreductase RutF